jgi:UDP-N-acetylmuramoylalanine--D-glutamate ligase
MGATVTVIDEKQPLEGSAQAERTQFLETLGVDVRVGENPALPERIDLMIPSPGIRPNHRWLARADLAGRIWSGEQLAWQLRPLEHPAPWLVVSGTNGKTTTVEMLAAILTASGKRAAAVGNIGRPLVETMFAEPAYDVLAVELSSFQLHWTHRIHPYSSTLLNVSADHIDWHGSFEAYLLDKARVYTGTEHAVLYNAQDSASERSAREADVAEGCVGVGFTLATPAAGMVGVVDGLLVDRAFVSNRRTHAVPLASLADLASDVPHNVANALAAAGLARSLGVSPAAVKQGLGGFELSDHRQQRIAVIDGVTYVDDSKATNVEAADVSLRAFADVVWIAGGLAKGATFDDVIIRHRDRLRGVVLIGEDRTLLRDALARHAPQVPVFEVVGGDTGVMDSAVRAAADMARPGDTALLAPACASMDQFASYQARGESFAKSVHRLDQ